MPLWSSRLLRPSSTPSGSDKTERSPDPAVKVDPNTSKHRISPMPPPHSISRQPDPPQARRHSRSLSNPLNSILARGKKAHILSRNGLAKDGQDRPLPSSAPEHRVPEFSNVSMSRSKPGAKEMEMGHCATCDSSVKWPKHLSAFRCMVCLMVNDVRQLGTDPWWGPENRTGEKRMCVHPAS